MKPLRLGFSTYSMPDADPFDAVERLAAIGYEAVELTVSDDYAACHRNLDPDDRDRLRELIAGEGMPSPVLMDLIAPCATGEARAEMLDHVEASFALAADLNRGDRPPVVKTPVSGEQPEWEGNEERVLADIVEIADVAAEYGAVFAPEVHVNTVLDTIEKARWLFGNTDHPNLGLNFDVSHFPRERFDVAEAVEVCAPLAVTTHVKDTEIVDGEVRFRLPGSTDFDYEWFLGALVTHGYRGDVIAEISAQLWREDDFDAWAGARDCYDNLADVVALTNERHADGT